MIGALEVTAAGLSQVLGTAVELGICDGETLQLIIKVDLDFWAKLPNDGSPEARNSYSYAATSTPTRQSQRAAPWGSRRHQQRTAQPYRRPGNISAAFWGSSSVRAHSGHAGGNARMGGLAHATRRPL